MKLLQMLQIGLVSLVLSSTTLFGMPTVEMDGEEEPETETPQVPAMVSLPNPILPASTSYSSKPASPVITTTALIESLSDEGPSTVNQDDDKIGTHGNWVKKKEYLMRAFDIQKDIETLATNIQSHRAVYQKKFSELDGELDTFYKQLGLEQSKTAELFSQLEGYVEQKKERKIERFKLEFTEARDQQMAIEQLEETLKVNKQELLQLKNDMKSIEDLDKSVNARLKRADEQIATAQQEAARSKKIMQALWDILDDKRAKAAYFDLKDGCLRKLQGIDAYLKQDLLSDLDKVSGTIKTQISKVRDEIKSLEEKGFLIRDRNKRLEELNEKKAREAAEKAAQENAPSRKKNAVAQKGFFSKIYDAVVDFIVNICRFFMQFFGGNSHELKAKKSNPVAPLQNNDAVTAVTDKAPIQAAQ